MQTKTVQIWALTMIDEGLSWPEIVAITNKYAEEIVTLVDDTWFARYPQPFYYIHDNGGEFIGSGFQELLDSYGVKAKPTTVKNPQSNGHHERIYLVLCEMLRVQTLYVPKESTAEKEINRILQCNGVTLQYNIKRHKTKLGNTNNIVIVQNNIITSKTLL